VEALAAPDRIVGLIGIKEMFKKFIDGLIFGAGFGVAVLTIFLFSIYFILPTVAEKAFNSLETGNQNPIETVPVIEAPKRYLGSTNITSSGFMRKGILAIGDGKITGSATANGKPLKGLKLRLALNGSVYSSWATTDLTGKYIVKVPYGEYIIEGFEIDKTKADELLPNMILHPQNPHSSNQFVVNSSLNGRGLNFKFVNPITKKFEKNKFKIDDVIILEWNDYPNAANYFVQIYEKSDPYSWDSVHMFEWSERPELKEPRINLKEYDVKLKPESFYTLYISARDKNNNIISESPRNHSGYDFEIIK
jgi:hypothetical protein